MGQASLSNGGCEEGHSSGVSFHTVNRDKRMTGGTFHSVKTNAAALQVLYRVETGNTGDEQALKR